MKKRIYPFFTLSLLILLSSCASILNGKKQDVLLKTNTNNAKVYVDNAEQENMSRSNITLDRDMETKQIRIEREGYKDQYEVAIQYKKSPWYIMSIVPFGILFYPITNDIAANSWDYPKELKITGYQKIPKNPDTANEILVRKTSFNVNKDDVTNNLINPNRYFKKGEVKVNKTEKSEVDLKAKNTIFSKAIYDILKDASYIDTTSTVIKNRAKLVNISADVKKMNVYSTYFYKRGHQPKAHFLELDVEWKLEDVYKKEIYKTVVSGKSGNFAGFFGEEKAKKSIKDAIESSLIKLLDKEDFKELMNNPVYKDKSFDELDINKLKAAKRPQNLDQAMKASCTIENDDGHGSGFFIGNDGYVLTNYHVVADQDKINIIDDQGNKHYAEIKRVSKMRDLALLKVNHQPEYSFSVSGKEDFKRGSEVYAVGTPTSVQLGQSLSKGIISGVRNEDGVEYIQIDASINPGNSGGPLINKNAELIGVINAKVKGIGLEGLGFAIPQKFIKEALELK